MRINRRRLPPALLFAAALAPLIEMPCAADSTETARNAIRSELEKWQSAFNNRDERGVCDLFAPDLIANYQGQPERDYTSLCRLLQTSVQDPERKYRYSFEINEMLVFGTTAIVRLVWTLEMEKRDAPLEVVREPAVDIFQRQDDGRWKISRYLAYPDVP